MKRAVSISIGSSKRDKVVEIDLLGERVSLERIGTDGDLEKAARLYGELDGKVDAFGVGGAILGSLVGEHWYSMHSVQSLIRFVSHTPVVDGTGLKMTLERQVAAVIDQQIGDYVKEKRAFVAVAVDRWGTAQSFLQAGYDCVFGDLMFSFGLPFPLRSEVGVRRMAAAVFPIASRLPFEWIYPIGESQNKNTPRWERYFDWATVVAGDCHYITRYMPASLQNKVIVTNTTTPEDRELFKKAGAKYLLTTTPVIDGRSFGTNVLEAAIVAVSGMRGPINYANAGTYFQDIEKLLIDMQIVPEVKEL